MIFDTFQAFGAQPVTTPANEIYACAQERKGRAQENPLAILDGFRLYELVKYVSLTNHMWSGFNLMSHLATWQSLPPDIRSVIERNATKYVRQQREDQAKLNAGLRDDFRRPRAGLQRYRSEGIPARLPAVYAKWKGQLGGKCWALIEDADRPVGVIHRT